VRAAGRTRVSGAGPGGPSTSLSRAAPDKTLETPREKSGKDRLAGGRPLGPGRPTSAPAIQDRGPARRLAAARGGHWAAERLSALLQGLKAYARPGGASPAVDITAVVTVTDDGGSSGRLRRDFDVLPPGDIRNCMVALSEDQRCSRAYFSTASNPAAA